MALRQGNVETTGILQKEGIYDKMYTNAGFYGNEKHFKKWKNEYIRALYNMDIHLDVMTCKSFVVCGDLLTKLNIWCPTLAYIEYIDYWLDIVKILMDNNKKICFVSYFSEEMKQQFKKINKIFTHVDLTNLKLEFVVSDNTIRGNEEHDSWCQTFEFLKKKKKKN